MFVARAIFVQSLFHHLQKNGLAYDTFTDSKKKKTSTKNTIPLPQVLILSLTKWP